jgi:hypothetical protein
MQGDSAIQDMDFQRALKASPFEEKDLPRLSAEIGGAYTRLTPDQKQQLQELADDLDTFSSEDLRNLRYFLGYLAKNKARYGLLVRKMYATGMLDEGVLPPKYEPAFFSLLTSLVDQALSKRRESSAEEAPAEGFAKGGIVSLKAAARRVQKAGRGGDTVLAHITPEEAALLKSRGGAGTINPKTGLPEYRSMFSLKSINNFFKKAAPIVLPIALNFLVPGLGAIASGFIGAGVGSLIGGAKPQDALRNAVIGGVTGGITAGIGNVVSGGNFFTGVEGALPSGFGGTSASSGGPGFFESMGEKLGFGAATGTPVPPGGMAGGLPNLPSTVVADAPKVFAGAGSPAVTSAASSGFGIGSLVDKGVGIVQRNPMTSLAVAGGLGALAAGGMGGKEKAAPSLVKGPTSRELMAQNPARYAFDIANFRPRSTTGMGLFSAAKGGLASNGDLAADGGKVDGPGTGTSDSIPARLSDGEFVFTAKAVRGAGDGSRMKGAKKMYEMMNKFERMA